MSACIHKHQKKAAGGNNIKSPVLGLLSSRWQCNVKMSNKPTF